MNEDNRVALEHERLRGQAKAHEAAVIARWRAAHPEATCNDTVALALAEMAASVGRLG